MAIKIKPFTKSDKILDQLFTRFKARAEELTVTVIRAADSQEGLESILKQVTELNIKKIVSPSLTMVDAHEIEKRTKELEIKYSTQLNRQKIEQADMGISEFNLGIADLGTLVQNASSLHTRLVSMLPPIHLALLPTTSLVESLAHTLEIIEDIYQRKVPPYLSFITGPSKTADIERELTIGVHGPGTLIIVLIDKITI